MRCNSGIAKRGRMQDKGKGKARRTDKVDKRHQRIPKLDKSEVLKKRAIKLKESEQTYRNIFKNIPDGILLADVETKKFRFGNDMICQMLGYSQKELKNLTVMDIHPQEDLPNVLEQFDKLAEEKVHRVQDIPVKRKNGSIFYADINAIMWTSEGKNYLAGVFRDVTERKRLREVLKEAEARYRTIVEDQIDFICRFMPDMTLTFVNDAYCRYFGKKKDELIGHSFMPLIPEQDRERVKEQILSLNCENPVGTHEHRVIGPAGEILWQQWTNRAIFDEQGNLAEFQAVGRDISERKRTEESITRAKKDLEQAVDAMTELIAVTDNQYRITRVNKEMAHRLGMTVKEATGLICYESLHENKKPPPFCPLVQLNALGREHSRDTRKTFR